MTSKDTSFEIKRLEYLQRKGLSPSAGRRVVGDLVQTIAKHNSLVSAENRTEARREMEAKNRTLAREAFDTHARGRKIL